MTKREVKTISIIIRKATLGAIYLIIFAIFCIVPSMEFKQLHHSTQMGKFLTFSYGILLVSVLGVLYLFNCMRRFSINIIDYSILLIVCFISFDYLSLSTLPFFSINYYELVALFIFYCVLRFLPLASVSSFFFAIIIGGTIQAALGCLQILSVGSYELKTYLVTGSFFNPGPFAGYLSSVFPITLGLLLFNSNHSEHIKVISDSNVPILYRLKKNYYDFISVALMLILLVMIPAQSRAAWLSMILSTLFLLYHRLKVHIFFLRLGKSKWKKLLFSIGLTLLLGTIAFFLYQLNTHSVNGRLLIWKVTLQMIADNWFDGIGFDMFQSKYMNYQARYFSGISENNESVLADNVVYAFNEPLQFFAENGLVLSGFVIILIIYLLIIIPSKKTSLVICKALIIGILSFSCFSYPSQVLPIKLIFVFSIATISSAQSEGTMHKFIRPQILNKSIFAILILGLTAMIYFSHTKLQSIYISFASWKAAILISESASHSDIIARYNEGYSVLKHNGEYLAQYGKALFEAKRIGRALILLKKAEKLSNNTFVQSMLGDCYSELKQYEKAAKAYRLAHMMTPDRYLPLYRLAKLYFAQYQYKKARAVAKLLLSKRPKVSSHAVKEILFEMRSIIRIVDSASFHKQRHIIYVNQ